jgi:hypothetical protein
VTDFQRYLRAKRAIDDRSLDRRLVGLLRDRLATRAQATDGPVRILEIGAGVGTMVTRAVEWDLLPAGEIQYTAVDIEAANIDTLPQHLREWASDRDTTVSTGGDTTVSTGGDTTVSTGDSIVLDTSESQITVEPVVAEAVDYADQTATAYDLLVGAALLDLLDLDQLDPLLGCLAPGGCYYFPITFDGATRFRPAHPADSEVERLYHSHMDRKPGGSSQAGDDLLARLQQHDGGSILGAAGSDWIVRPADGAYPGDEAYFLSHILGTVETALGELDEEITVDLDNWLSHRRDQLDAGELIYFTHQLDILGQIDG